MASPAGTLKKSEKSGFCGAMPSQSGASSSSSSSSPRTAYTHHHWPVIMGPRGEVSPPPPKKIYPVPPRHLPLSPHTNPHLLTLPSPLSTCGFCQEEEQDSLPVDTLVGTRTCVCVCVDLTPKTHPLLNCFSPLHCSSHLIDQSFATWQKHTSCFFMFVFVCVFSLHHFVVQKLKTKLFTNYFLN